MIKIQVEKEEWKLGYKLKIFGTDKDGNIIAMAKLVFEPFNPTTCIVDDEEKVVHLNKKEFQFLIESLKKSGVFHENM